MKDRGGTGQEVGIRKEVKRKARKGNRGDKKEYMNRAGGIGKVEDIGEENWRRI